MPDPLLAAEDLAVDRGGRTIFARLSFTLSAGEALLVTGRNGAGKSTLLRTLCGLLPARAGRIVYGLADEEVRGVETMHYLGYEDALKPALGVGENLAFWSRMLGRRSGAMRPKSQLVSADAPGARDASLGMTPGDALSALGIARLHDLPAGYLSAGQKRRVALARLLVVARPIWLLDEPLIALDVGAQALLTAHMERHLAQGGAILVASHQPLALPHRVIDLAGQARA